MNRRRRTSALPPPKAITESHSPPRNAFAASATDLQILCPEGARVRLDGADAGVCSEVEEGRYLRDLSPGTHVVEITVPGGGPWSHEIELDETVPGRLDARCFNHLWP